MMQNILAVFTETSVIAAIVQLGLSVVLVVFFVWQADKREQRMSKSIEELQNFVRKELMAAHREGVAAIVKSTEMMAAHREGVAAIVKSTEMLTVVCEKLDELIERVVRT